MAGYLDILPTADEPVLFSVAAQALIELPEGWSIGITSPANDNNGNGNDNDSNDSGGGERGVSGEREHTGVPYFFREICGTSSWQHPEVQKWKDRVVMLRAGSTTGIKANSNGGGDTSE